MWILPHTCGKWRCFEVTLVLAPWNLDFLFLVWGAIKAQDLTSDLMSIDIDRRAVAADESIWDGQPSRKEASSETILTEKRT